MSLFHSLPILTNFLKSPPLRLVYFDPPLPRLLNLRKTSDPLFILAPRLLGAYEYCVNSIVQTTIRKTYFELTSILIGSNQTET